MPSTTRDAGADASKQLHHLHHHHHQCLFLNAFVSICQLSAVASSWAFTWQHLNRHTNTHTDCLNPSSICFSFLFNNFCRVGLLNTNYRSDSMTYWLTDSSKHENQIISKRRKRKERKTKSTTVCALDCINWAVIGSDACDGRCLRLKQSQPVPTSCSIFAV